jgi:chromosome partitioning protein
MGAPILVIGNEKGGTGKSTIVANLAVMAIMDKLSVMTIDTDTQQSLMDFQSVRAGSGLPQFKAVSITNDTIHRDAKDFNGYDLILIDAGGRDNPAFRSAVTAADWLLIPVLPSGYDIWAAQNTISILEAAMAYKTISARFILNQVISNTRISQDALQALQGLKIRVLDTKLCSRVAYKQSISEGKGVIEYEPNGKAANEISELWNEIKMLIGIVKK